MLELRPTDDLNNLRLEKESFHYNQPIKRISYKLPIHAESVITLKNKNHYLDRFDRYYHISTKENVITISTVDGELPETEEMFFDLIYQILHNRRVWIYATEGLSRLEYAQLFYLSQLLDQVKESYLKEEDKGDDVVITLNHILEMDKLVKSYPNLSLDRQAGLQFYTFLEIELPLYLGIPVKYFKEIRKTFKDRKTSYLVLMFIDYLFNDLVKDPENRSRDDFIKEIDDHITKLNQKIAQNTDTFTLNVSEYQNDGEELTDESIISLVSDYVLDVEINWNPEDLDNDIALSIKFDYCAYDNTKESKKKIRNRIINTVISHFNFRKCKISY
jgi:hypothetical protein